MSAMVRVMTALARVNFWYDDLPSEKRTKMWIVGALGIGLVAVMGGLLVKGLILSSCIGLFYMRRSWKNTRLRGR